MNETLRNQLVEACETKRNGTLHNSLLERVARLEAENRDLRETLSKRDYEFEQRLSYIERTVGSNVGDSPQAEEQVRPPDRY